MRDLLAQGSLHVRLAGTAAMVPAELASTRLWTSRSSAASTVPGFGCAWSSPGRAASRLVGYVPNRHASADIGLNVRLMLSERIRVKSAICADHRPSMAGALQRLPARQPRHLSVGGASPPHRSLLRKDRAREPVRPGNRSHARHGGRCCRRHVRISPADWPEARLSRASTDPCRCRFDDLPRRKVTYRRGRRSCCSVQ